ncbi:hypothetical protein ACS0PU_003877 [Formica fusca]
MFCLRKYCTEVQDIQDEFFEITPGGRYRITVRCRDRAHTCKHLCTTKVDERIKIYASQRFDCECTYTSKTGCQGRTRSSRGQRPGIVLERSRSEVKAKR